MIPANLLPWVVMIGFLVVIICILCCIGRKCGESKGYGKWVLYVTAIVTGLGVCRVALHFMGWPLVWGLDAEPRMEIPKAFIAAGIVMTFLIAVLAKELLKLKVHESVWLGILLMMGLVWFYPISMFNFGFMFACALIFKTSIVAATS